MKQELSAFIETRRKLIEMLDRLPISQVDRILIGEWALKSVIAHLIGWDQYFTHIVLLLEKGDEIPYWGSINRFNERSISARQDTPWQEIYQEFIATGEEFIRVYSQIPMDLKETPFWAARRYTPSDIVEINIHHYVEHLNGIHKMLAESEKL